MKEFTREDFFGEMSRLKEYDRKKERLAAARWNLIRLSHKPPALLDAVHSRLSGWSPEGAFAVSPRALFIFASDHGLMDEGQLMEAHARTGDVVRLLAQGRAPASLLAQGTQTDLIPVNLGLRDLDQPLEGVVHAPILAKGSFNPMKGDALPEEAMMTAIRLGMEMAAQAAERGFRLLMASAAAESSDLIALLVIAALTDRLPGDLSEKGPRLPDELFARQNQILEEALRLRQPDKYNAFDVLAKIGGLDLAAMTGFFAGAARFGIPVLLDGTASLASAMLLTRLLPETRPIFFASASPAEPAGELAFRALGLLPMIETPLPYGGGSGALMTLSLLDLAASLYQAFESFEN